MADDFFSSVCAACKQVLLCLKELGDTRIQGEGANIARRKTLSQTLALYAVIESSSSDNSQLLGLAEEVVERMAMLSGYTKRLVAFPNDQVVSKKHSSTLKQLVLLVKKILTIVQIPQSRLDAASQGSLSPSGSPNSIQRGTPRSSTSVSLTESPLASSQPMQALTQSRAEIPLSLSSLSKKLIKSLQKLEIYVDGKQAAKFKRAAITFAGYLREWQQLFRSMPSSFCSVFDLVQMVEDSKNMVSMASQSFKSTDMSFLVTFHQLKDKLMDDIRDIIVAIKQETEEHSESKNSSDTSSVTLAASRSEVPVPTSASSTVTSTGGKDKTEGSVGGNGSKEELTALEMLLFNEDGTVNFEGGIDFSISPKILSSVKLPYDGPSLNTPTRVVLNKLRNALKHPDDVLHSAIQGLTADEIQRFSVALGRASPAANNSNRSSMKRTRSHHPSEEKPASPSPIKRGRGKSTSISASEPPVIINVGRKQLLTWIDTMAWDAKNANIFPNKNDNKCLAWEPHDQTNTWRLSGGTIDALFDYVTHNLSCKALVTTLIVTHEHFTSPRELMLQFVDNFTGAMALGNEAKKNKQCSIVFALKQWWKYNLAVFEKDSEVIQELLAFFDMLKQNPEFKSWHQMLSNWWHTAIEKEMQDVAKKTMHNILFGPAVPSDPKINLLSFTPLDVAQQLTLRTHYLFSLLPPRELVKKRYEDHTKCPNLLQMSKHFNWETSWAVSEILSETRSKHRTKVLLFIIRVAQHLFDLRNYNSLMAVFVAISDSSITRLAKSWREIPSQEFDLWKKLEDIMNPVGNFKRLREIMNTVAAPLVPLSSMLIKDLIFIEEGNEDHWKDNEEHLNVEKLLMIGQVLARIQYIQRLPYPLLVNEKIHSYFPTVQLIAVKDRLETSKKLEPA